MRGADGRDLLAQARTRVLSLQRRVVGPAAALAALAALAAAAAAAAAWAALAALTVLPPLPRPSPVTSQW